MKGDFHVRFCERLKLQCFGLLNRFSNSPTSQSPVRCTQTTTITLKKFTLTISLIVVVHGFSFAQLWDKTNGCITDTIKDTEAVFTRFTSEPMFKGNMKWFLTKNISLDIFLHSMQPSDTVILDTARFQFLMSKKGEISNVTISKAKSLIFQTEVMRLFRLSSCSWQIGDQGGRYVNGWAQFEIYFRLTRKYGEIKINVDYKQIVPVDLSL